MTAFLQAVAFASSGFTTLAAVAPAGLIVRGPLVQPRSPKPVGATFDPADNRVSNVDYFTGPGAKANTGLKKASAERSITFVLDAFPKMPLPQKREVPPPPPAPPCTRPTLGSLPLQAPPLPLRGQIATFALDVHGEGVKVVAKNEKLSVWQEAVSLTAVIGVAVAAFALSFIFAHEGMSYKLTGNDMAQIAGLTASVSAAIFTIVFAVFKGRND